MSSFGRYCEVARDGAEPIGQRYKSLRYAAERYSWLTRTSFQSVFDDLRDRCGLRVGVLNSDLALVAAATELENARRAFLVQVNTLTAQRKLEKRGGRRSPRVEWVEGFGAVVTLGRLRAALWESAIAGRLAADEPVATPPEFTIGALVEVILNTRNRTPHHGKVERRAWHFKLGRWMYFLRQGSRRISKRYFAEDLRPWAGAG